MENKEITINLKMDLFEKLEAIARENGSSTEVAAEKLLSETLKSSKSPAKTPSMPGVALVKEGMPDLSPSFNRSATTRSDLFSGLQADKPVLSPEKLQRRKQLEAQMQEVSLLIQTAANEEKKQEYSMQYAMLAAEIEAIV